MTLATLLEILSPLGVFVLAQLVWFVICMIIKVYDMAFSAILLKLPSEKIGNLYTIGATVISIMFATLSTYSMLKR